MNKKYKTINGFLTKLDYNFEELKTAESIDINTKEVIKLKSVSDTEIDFLVTRELVFVPFDNTYIKVEFDVNCDLSVPVDKETFKKDVKNNIPQLTNIFSKISLIISEVTAISPFGTLITAPMYNCKEIIVED